jgi:hypothetical protein
MNEQTPTIQNTLENALISSIEGIKKTGTELVDALYQQAPEVINQLLVWHGVDSIINFVFGIFLVFGMPLITCKIISKLYTKFKVNEWKKGETVDFWAPSLIIGIVCNIACILIGSLVCMNLKWLKIWLAPKVYLLEYLATLVK